MIRDTPSRGGLEVGKSRGWCLWDINMVGNGVFRITTVGKKTWTLFLSQKGMKKLPKEKHTQEFNSRILSRIYKVRL